MLDLLWLIPLVPALSAALLIVFWNRLPALFTPLLGVGSVGVSALLVLGTALEFLESAEPVRLLIGTWFSTGGLNVEFAFHLDGLTLVMLSVITGVGFLIHLFSAEFMAEDSDRQRYFAYLNLFVAAMLVLVLADNLALMFLGWEGVGLCSYLLIGFWYRDPANGAAARKAFIVTRIGDAAMALGLFLLFREFGTLNFAELADEANRTREVGDSMLTIATLLLLGGAAGKSAQLPLQTWLPDAMAGPTPVSALIHAATMVTAGVYLIARTHELYLLAPFSLTMVALVGLATLLIAAFAAMAQNDIKRILAYSTISQIGYMFLGLGVGAWSSAIFHMMTHAFFKALLFLGAGAIIHCLHHEHDIRRMGGLMSRLPIVFASFLIGSAALAALPFTSGFYSKDQILLAAWGLHGIGPWLWAGGLLGALVTSIYSFRLVFVVFFGDTNTMPDNKPGWQMSIPLAILVLLSFVGGWFSLPLDSVFAAGDPHPHPSTIVAISISVPIVGVLIAYLLFLGRQLRVDGLVNSALGKSAGKFWLGGWGFDTLYATLITRPYSAVATLCKSEPIDRLYHAVVSVCVITHGFFSRTQNGQLRIYATAMVIGLILVLGLLLRAGA